MTALQLSTIIVSQISSTLGITDVHHKQYIYIAIIELIVDLMRLVWDGRSLASIIVGQVSSTAIIENTSPKQNDLMEDKDRLTETFR